MRRGRREPRPAPRVDLRLDSVHLHGFSSADREVVLAALERELGRLVAERGLPSAAPLHIATMRIECAPARDPGDAGRDAARSLYAKLRMAGQPGGGT